MNGARDWEPLAEQVVTTAAELRVFLHTVPGDTPVRILGDQRSDGVLVGHYEVTDLETGETVRLVDLDFVEHDPEPK